VKIIVRRSGGFAAPNLDKAFELKTESLPHAEARIIEAFSSGPSIEALNNQSFRAAGTADSYRYEVAIETPRGPMKFLFDESAVPKSFQSAWNVLKKKIGA
jgi:hypothetical protein